MQPHYMWPYAASSATTGCLPSSCYQTPCLTKHQAAVFLCVCCALLQLCFDFIESAADGKLYCIECNPRTSSVITEFHDNPNLVTGGVV